MGIGQSVRALLEEAEMKISRRKDFAGALIDLNRAATLDPANETVREKIQEVRELKRGYEKGTVTGEIETFTITHEDDEGKQATVSRPEERRAEKIKREAEAKEKRYKAFQRTKKIKKTSLQKIYLEKIEEYVRNARQYIDQKQFDKAKEEVERIFLFDPDNQLAKDMIEQITDYEVRNLETEKKVITLDEEFERSVEIEKLKVALQEKSDELEVTGESALPERDEKSKKKAIKRLIKDGKALYKRDRYFEARQKFEAVFALDDDNKKASKYLDKINEAMLVEREEERKMLRERQRAQINDKLDAYAREIRQLHNEGRYTDAAILIEKGLLLDPSNRYFKELKKQNMRGAQDEMKMERTPQEEKQNFINLAIKNYIQGNYVEAKKYFEKVLEIDPDDEKAKNSIAKLDKKINSLQLGE